MAAKRKEDGTTEQRPTKKPTKAVPVPGSQVSICIPSTAIANKNAHNLEQVTNIAYQIARIATTYSIGEIIILDVPSADDIVEDEKIVQTTAAKGATKIKFNFTDEDIIGKKAEPTVVAEEKEPEVDTESSLEDNAYLLATLLQYFITPPYLVKTIFNMTGKKGILQMFKYASKLPKITTLPFMNNNGVYKNFKEGITIPKETAKIYNKKLGKKVKSQNKISVTKYVNIGEAEAMELDIKREVPVNARVTIDLKNKTIVSPQEAYGVSGNKSAFGYYIRMCKKFSNVFTESSVEDGYSASYYVNCDDYNGVNIKNEDYAKIPKVKVIEGEEPKKNLLLILGNYKDLEVSFVKDKKNLPGVENVGEMFDGELIVPGGIRIEDGVAIGLTKVYS